MKSLTLEELCRPVLSFICDARRYNCAKHQITLTEFTDGIMFRLNAIQEQCRQDVVLAKEYAKIEKPLLFFIDYIVMDGNFSFANEWEP